jgi:hypothetical protein
MISFPSCTFRTEESKSLRTERTMPTVDSGRHIHVGVLHAKRACHGLPDNAAATLFSRAMAAMMAPTYNQPTGSNSGNNRCCVCCVCVCVCVLCHAWSKAGQACFKRLEIQPESERERERETLVFNFLQQWTKRNGMRKGYSMLPVLPTYHFFVLGSGKMSPGFILWIMYLMQHTLQRQTDNGKANYFCNVWFEVFMAVTMKNGVFWDVTPCGSCKNRRFGRT